MEMIKKWLPLALLATVFLFTACEPDEPFELEEETEVSTEDPSANYQVLLDLVNDLRASGCRCGNQVMPPVAPLQWNDKIASASRQHSEDMSDNDHFSHAGTDGSDAGQRLTRNGYQWRAYGENIAFGYDSASAVFQGWFDSPGHCKNMMSASFEDMGAARIDLYWTQDFGAEF